MFPLRSRKGGRAITRRMKLKLPKARPDRKPASLQVEEELLPGLRTFAHAIDQADKLLLALGRGTNDDQQALRVVLEPGLHVDAVDPEVHVAFGGDLASLSRAMVEAESPPASLPSSASSASSKSPVPR